MLDYIRGTLSYSSPLHATVDIQGLGYQVLIPLNNYAKLPALGKEVLLYLSLIVREDSHKLFGFLTRTERDLFERLLDVSGIGPKTALALIGHMETVDLQLAISQANIALLSKVPGIGKKTAERLVIDLRDKLKKMDVGTIPEAKEKGTISDAISALVNLGYPPLQAQKAIRTVLSQSPEEPSLANLITAALRFVQR